MRVSVAGTLFLALAACGPSAPGPAASDGASVVERASPAVPAPTPTTSTTADAPPQAQLVLEGEGLRAIDPANGHATPIAFGTEADQAIAMISAALGTPEGRSANEDCPAGPVETARWNKGLSANFQDGKFVGWAGAVDLTTASGIGFGSSRAALTKAYDATIERTSLGTEFTVGGISGVLESDAPDAAISDMWAGISCVAR